jgi:lysophospholipase I
MAPLQPIEVPARGKHTATLIVAHGLGDTGHGWSFLANQWKLQNKFGHVKFIFPTAPIRKITIVGAIG